MKRLKIILNFNGLYYFLLFIILILYIIFSNINFSSTYKDFNHEKFVITSIEEKDYGLKLGLKGKEKVLGYYYLDGNEIDTFKNSYILGSKVLIEGEKLDITNNTVPNTFNYKRYLESNKIYNVIEIKDIKKIRGKISIFYKLKNICLSRADKITYSRPYIYSLIFGSNVYLDEDLLFSYRNNGISYLFAISGFHIAIFLYVLGLIVSKIPFLNRFKYIIFIVFLLYFMFLTNFSTSVLRASIFTILLIINKVFNLEIKSINLLFLTLFIICINNPLALNNIGLIYSFVNTLFLILYKPLLKVNYIKKLFLISLLSFIVSFPITAGNFYQINFLSILYSLIFVPLMSFIIIPLTIIVYTFPCMDFILYFCILIIERISLTLNLIDIFKVTLCKQNLIVYMLYYVILLIITCKAKNIYLFSLILMLSLFFLCYSNVFEQKNYILSFDVGQGDSTFVKLDDSNMLIDTGGVSMSDSCKYTYKLSKNKLIPYLKSVGERQIDTLVLTHGDADHMGEAKYLVSNFTVKKVIFNVGEFNTLENDLIKALKEKNVKYYQNISKLEVDDTMFYFLNTKEYDNENDNSNVIYFELNRKKFLFMGDAGVEREKDILDKYNIKNIDVLKVGHHGSKTSSSREFIYKINPQYSIISVGKDNRYGHPNKEVLDNLNNSKIYRTDKNGSIMFELKNNKLKIETYNP